MGFSFLACDGGLAKYKAEAKTTIEAYAQSKGQIRYSTDNWDAIKEFVATGKIAVDTATDKAGVETAVNSAKQAIDAIPQTWPAGELDGTLINKIRQDYLETFDENYISQNGYTIDNVIFARYCGTYNGYVIVTMGLYTGMSRPGFQNLTIAGFDFFLPGDYSYLMWKDGQFNSWLDAYERGILSQDDISNIHQYYGN